MIKKIYRLKEKEVKKVLSRGKPFFSYGIVLNKLANKKDYNRFAIVIGAKSVNTNVERNFFRRKFFDLACELLGVEAKKTYDFVFVVKKQTKLDKKQQKSIKDFEQNLKFLARKTKFNSN